ncbi:MAG TPA: DUF2061 domain-containing protein [Bacteroidales bacterium]|jgi:uncharacterized membrane protein|nr:DUF2061 domain-containing protein [Bacteroidales bacterium]
MIDALINSVKEKNLKTDNSTKVIIKTDKPVKSFIKSVSWRVVGTIDTMIISYFITGKVTLAVSIGSVEVITKTFLYYFHERVWAHIHRMKLNVFSKSNGCKLEFEEPESASFKGEGSGKSQKSIRTVSG